MYNPASWLRQILFETIALYIIFISSDPLFIEERWTIGLVQVRVICKKRDIVLTSGESAKSEFLLKNFDNLRWS